ncbi:hypothetical protein GE09DRAFT_1164842 [Coniochaeta sp. 2T2.1]|nr:hypothetical protein GE09DRAFT_1164842 [Coniochaeta sp. 2T2.1]
MTSANCPSQAIYSVALAQSVCPAMRLDTFPFFPRLPPEIRLMIWEKTWPETRVIEAAYAEAVACKNADEPFERVALRMTGRLSTWLHTDVRCSILEDAPLEKCLDPVALWVCHESRTHTLRRFTRIVHSNIQAKPFYFRPDQDLIWLNADVTDDSLYQKELRDHYGEQLDKIERVLVEEEEWAIPGLYPNCLGMLQGLQVIQVLQEREIVTEQPEAEEDSNQSAREEHARQGWIIQYIDRSVL